jgi:hypothetical protein
MILSADQAEGDVASLGDEAHVSVDVCNGASMMSELGGPLKGLIGINSTENTVMFYLGTP